MGYTSLVVFNGKNNSTVQLYHGMSFIPSRIFEHFQISTTIENKTGFSVKTIRLFTFRELQSVLESGGRVFSPEVEIDNDNAGRPSAKKTGSVRSVRPSACNANILVTENRIGDVMFHTADRSWALTDDVFAKVTALLCQLTFIFTHSLRIYASRRKCASEKHSGPRSVCQIFLNCTPLTHKYTCIHNRPLCIGE